MIHNRAPLFVVALILLATSCSQQGNQNLSLPTLPTGMNGSWTGVVGGVTLVQLDLLEQLGPVKPGSGFIDPGFIVSGSGYLTSGGCTQAVTVSGVGDGHEYLIDLTGSGVNAYVIELFGIFQSDQLSENDLFVGDYFMTLGDPGEACISGGAGLFQFGRTALEGVEGTFTGSWTGADTLSFRTSQTSALVYGAARWSDYTCARDAYFFGTRTGDQVIGTLVPLFSSLTSYDVVFDWDPDARTMDGGFTVTGVAAGSPCVMGDLGTFSVGSISNAEAGTGGGSVSVMVLEWGPEAEEPELVLQYEARSQ